MKAIIFGASGQDGFYMQQLLLQQNIECIAVSRSETFINIDIANYEQVYSIIKKEQPNYIFNFAANSTTSHSAIVENNLTIGNGTLHIFEAVKNFCSHCKVFICGSGLQFKNEHKPIKETDEFEAKDGYSATRIYTTYLARYYRTLGLKIYIGYLFNHDSPVRTEKHLTKKISEAVKRIGLGSIEKIEIGNLNAVKEYTYAKDVVDGIWMFINQDKIFELNIGSGIGYSVKDWIIECFKLIDKDWQNYIVPNPNYIEQTNYLVSDNSILKAMGWEQQVDFFELAKLMMK